MMKGIQIRTAEAVNRGCTAQSEPVKGELYCLICGSREHNRVNKLVGLDERRLIKHDCPVAFHDDWNKTKTLARNLKVCPYKFAKRDEFDWDKLEKSLEEYAEIGDGYRYDPYVYRMLYMDVHKICEEYIRYGWRFKRESVNNEDDSD